MNMWEFWVYIIVVEIIVPGFVFSHGQWEATIGWHWPIRGWVPNKAELAQAKVYIVKTMI